MGKNLNVKNSHEHGISIGIIGIGKVALDTIKHLIGNNDVPLKNLILQDKYKPRNQLKSMMESLSDGAPPNFPNNYKILSPDKDYCTNSNEDSAEELLCSISSDNLEALINMNPDVCIITTASSINANNTGCDEIIGKFFSHLEEFDKKRVHHYNDISDKEAIRLRFKRMFSNLAINTKIAPQFRDYEGVVILLPNPIEIILYDFISQSGLSRYNLFAEPKVDEVRFKSELVLDFNNDEELVKKYGMINTEWVKNAKVYGEHGLTMVPIFSDVFYQLNNEKIYLRELSNYENRTEKIRKKLIEKALTQINNGVTTEFATACAIYKSLKAMSEKKNNPKNDAIITTTRLSGEDLIPIAMPTKFNSDMTINKRFSENFPYGNNFESIDEDRIKTSRERIKYILEYLINEGNIKPIKKNF